MSSKKTSIEFQNLNLEKCFQNFYVVPDYQREYVWEEQQVNQLLNDIYEEYDDNSDKEYFIGSIVVFDNDGTLELIDGQQRITTLFLIVCALKDVYTEMDIDTAVLNRMIKNVSVNRIGEEEDKYRIVLQYSDASDYLKRIANNTEYTNDITESGNRLYLAYENAKTFLRQNFKTAEDLKRFFAHLYRNIRFIQIETPDISDALKIFETINERGVGLSPMDLLKNLIFRQVEREDFTKLKGKWENLIRMLENKGEKPLRFLRYFIMANYNVENARKDSIVREDEIYNWFLKNENQCGYNRKPFIFVDHLISSANSYINFYEGKDNFGENVYLDNIKKLGGGAFRQHLILFLAAKDKSKEIFDYLSKNAEVLIFYYFITKEPTRNFEKSFAKWAGIIQNVKTIEDMKGFIKENFLSELQERQKAFEPAFLNIDENTMQKFRIRYILAKIAQHIKQARRGDGNERSLDDFIAKGIEIEHILPATSERELRESIGDNYDELKIRLGNLTLLEKPINGSIGNKDFYDVKRAAYLESEIYLTRSIAKVEDVGTNTAINRINQKLKNWELWNENSIIERQQMLYELAIHIWEPKL